jgi:hypothetical protein
MILEKKFSHINEQTAEEPKILIKYSTDAPDEIKQNPFYDPEIWGRANSPDDIYLPDSDEAISFAIAAHEIGHLVKMDKRNDTSLDNFRAVQTEEQRAWEKGWEYLQANISEYYQNKVEPTSKISQSFENIKTLFLQATNLSKDMYLEKGALDNLSKDKIQLILKEKREKFFSEKGFIFKEIFKKIKNEKVGIKTDWDKFVIIIKKTVEKILKDNAQKN